MSDGTSMQTPADAMGQFRTLSIDEALGFAAHQVRQLVTSSPGRLATYTENGRWVIDDDPWAPTWTGGFLTGMMWIFANHTGDSWWRRQAERYCLLLEPHKQNTGTHDLGFILEPSWGRWYDRDGSERARNVLIEGGRTMAHRFQQTAGYLSSWVDPGNTFIDIMMNVGIIFRAAEYSADYELAQIGLRHCRTSRRYLMRGDGSTVHEGWFDTHSGEYLHAGTHQGWRSDSSWARGQSWAIYGFDNGYRHSGEASLLDAARRAADYYIDRTPSHGVPPNDWAEPTPTLALEASAAAIAAAGMLRLADTLATDPAAERYRGYALRILETLRSTKFIAADANGWEGILRHATYHYRRGLGVSESVMFGDYYLVEALEMARHLEAGVRPGT